MNRRRFLGSVLALGAAPAVAGVPAPRDDTAELQDLIDRAWRNGSRRVYLPRGVYHLRSDTRLRFRGIIPVNPDMNITYSRCLIVVGDA